VAFDRIARTLTDTSSDGTVVQTFATLADFVDMADPVVFLKRGGPATVRTATDDTTFSYDSQRRLASMFTTGSVGPRAVQPGRRSPRSARSIVRSLLTTDP